MIVTSAFGVEHTVTKSFIPGGGDNDYKESHLSASETTRPQRLEIAGRISSARKARHKGLPSGTKPDRGVKAVYAQHGYFNRSIPFTDEDGTTHDFGSTKDPVEEMREHTTPSKMHRNVHYGASVHPDDRVMIDSNIEPHLVRALKHPVVIHHDPDSPHSAAISAHTTTGGKGHIVMGMGGIHHEPDTINHELVHASPTKRNPVIGPKKLARYSGGEEGRADAVSGTDLYTKIGAMPAHSPSTRAANKVLGSKPGRKALTAVGLSHVNDTVATVSSYHRANQAVKAARMLKP